MSTAASSARPHRLFAVPLWIAITSAHIAAPARAVMPPEANEANQPSIVSQQQKLVDPQSFSKHTVGTAVALDGTTLVFSNPFRAVAFVYVLVGQTWVLQAELRPPTSHYGFGTALAVSGNTVLVGDRAGGPNREGVVYVYVRNGTQWTQQARLMAADATPDDAFGIALALDGSTALIGAPGVSASRGAAYAFLRSGSNWTQQARLQAFDGAAQDYFGGSVAILGNTAIVGAPLDDVGTNQGQGSAYAFVRSGSAWTQHYRFTANDGEAGDQFGYAVALDGDTVLVGSPESDVGANDRQGAAYSFVRSGSTWSFQTQLIALFVSGPGDKGGSSVALQGKHAFLGAPGYAESNQSRPGAAFQFERSNNGWLYHRRIEPLDGGNADQIGRSLALDDNTLLIGAPMHNEARGAAYVFQGVQSVFTNGFE